MDGTRIAIGMDLEEYRQARGWTYDQLADHFGIPQNRTALAYAVGESWPRPERLDHIIETAGGEITVVAMHKRRLAWIREHKGDRANLALPHELPGRALKAAG